MTQIDMDTLKEELLQCRRCGLCRNAVYETMGFDGVCPVWKNTSGFETSFMRGKIMVALALLDGIIEKTPQNAEALFQCTLCGNCAKICASEFHPARALEQVRQVLNDIPNESRDSIAQKIMAHDNPYTETGGGKREWVAQLSFEVPTKGETVYFVGCTAAMKMPQVALASAKIMRAAGVDFAVMEDEPCCGSVMLRTGKGNEARQNASKAAEAIAATGAKRLVVSCAGCLKTLREDYAGMGLEMPEVVHIVELAEELIRAGRLHPRQLKERFRVTYHDPCHMGRELGIYDAPRSVLRAIPGIELVEMPTKTSAAMCCGAGGGLRSFDSNLSKRIAADRMASAEVVKADVMASACPFCETNLNAGRELIDSKVGVLDVVELLARSLD
ncbi:MAG: (Fe-S)-binding protein [Candidatus Thorarchaeota archaeon]|nr:(Fe-S)-binding protein [Candidatus Thorarchaeota archaeon]